MSVGLVKIRNNRYYLTISDQSYVELLRRIRIIPDFNTKTPPPTLRAKNKALAKMYYLVPGNKVNWTYVHYDRNVRYALWCAWREWVNIDKLNEFTHAGEIYNDSKQNLTKAIYSEKSRGHGEAVEGVVFTIKNGDQLEYNDCDELRKSVKYILEIYTRETINYLNTSDPDYKYSLIRKGYYNEEHIERLVDDFVDFWTTEPNRDNPYILQRYNSARYEAFLRGTGTEIVPIGGILYDFCNRFIRFRGMDVMNSTDGKKIETQGPKDLDEINVDNEVSNIYNEIDMNIIFDVIKDNIPQVLTDRQQVFLHLIIKNQYYVSHYKKDVIAEFIHILADLALNANRSTVYNEIKNIEKIIGEKIIRMMTDNEQNFLENITRAIFRYCTSHTAFINRSEEICPDILKIYLDEQRE